LHVLVTSIYLSFLSFPPNLVSKRVFLFSILILHMLLPPSIYETAMKMSGDDSNCDSTFAVPQADIYKFARRTFKGQPVEDLIPHQFGSSVVIPKELFEAMYLDPDVRTRRHLRSGFGNPTPMYVPRVCPYECA
jgi:hypothetical protein